MQIIPQPARQVLLHAEDISAIAQARDIIDNHLNQHFTIRELSKKVCLNEFKLKYGFRFKYGTGLHKYLRIQRFEKAKELLFKGKQVEEIAELVGYKSVSSFCQSFKKEVGIPPLQWISREAGKVLSEATGKVV